MWIMFRPALPELATFRVATIHAKPAQSSGRPQLRLTRFPLGSDSKTRSDGVSGMGQFCKIFPL